MVRLTDRSDMTDVYRGRNNTTTTNESISDFFILNVQKGKSYVQVDQSLQTERPFSRHIQYIYACRFQRAPRGRTNGAL